MEDFGGGTTSLFLVELNKILNTPIGHKMEEDVPQDVVDDGVRVMEEMLRTWASQADGEDVIMSDEPSVEVQLENLQKHFETYRPRIEDNQWLQSVIASL